MPETQADRAFFTAHIEQHLDRLYAAALRLTHHAVNAEDLVADTVTRAWSAIETLHDTGRFLPWLLRIMTNLFISEQRKAQAKVWHEAYVEEPAGNEPAFSIFERLHQPFLLWWGNPEQTFMDELLGEHIEAALAELPEPFRLVVILSDLEGLTYTEIGEALDVPVGTVRSRLARARGQLQKLLWQHAVDRGLVNNEPQE
ncbi:MAG: RNA polymerase sigma factor [Granulosicoccaceae bacterium]|jgi:RNA polymerase sigma-70 factor (ECF subfamily)